MSEGKQTFEKPSLVENIETSMLIPGSRIVLHYNNGNKYFLNVLSNTRKENGKNIIRVEISRDPKNKILALIPLNPMRGNIENQTTLSADMGVIFSDVEYVDGSERKEKSYKFSGSGLLGFSIENEPVN